jgi:hypothetical protein
VLALNAKTPLPQCRDICKTCNYSDDDDADNAESLLMKEK